MSTTATRSVHTLSSDYTPATVVSQNDKSSQGRDQYAPDASAISTRGEANNPKNSRDFAQGAESPAATVAALRRLAASIRADLRPLLRDARLVDQAADFIEAHTYEDVSLSTLIAEVDAEHARDQAPGTPS
jgi:hypothetical protein